MGNDKFAEIAKAAVIKWYERENKKLSEEDVYVVWSCKTLQNNKALVSTTVSDGMYFELTYNGDKDELYVDAYKKWENVCIKSPERILE